MRPFLSTELGAFDCGHVSTACIRTCKHLYIHRFCKRNDMDCIFMAVDAAAANDHKHQLSEMKRAPSPPKSPSAKAGLMLSQGSVKNRLSRYEFLAALVHVAIKKYIMSGELADVSI